MQNALRALNILAIVALIVVLCYWGSEIRETLRYQPVVVKIDKVAYDVSAGDGTVIYIIEGGKDALHENACK